LEVMRESGLEDVQLGGPFLKKYRVFSRAGWLVERYCGVVVCGAHD